MTIVENQVVILEVLVVSVKMLEVGRTIQHQNQHHKTHQLHHHKMIGMMANDEIIGIQLKLLIVLSSLQFEVSVANDSNHIHS